MRSVADEYRPSAMERLDWIDGEVWIALELNGQIKQAVEDRIEVLERLQALLLGGVLVPVEVHFAIGSTACEAEETHV